MYRLGAISLAVLVIMTITTQLTRLAGYNRAIEETNIINTQPHKAAMIAQWPNATPYNSVNNTIKVTVKAEIDEVVYNRDMRFDTLSVIMGGHLYNVTVATDPTHEFKKGDLVDVCMELQYEPISLVRNETIFSTSTMKVN